MQFVFHKAIPFWMQTVMFLKNKQTQKQNYFQIKPQIQKNEEINNE